MKKFVLLIFIFILILWGCNHDSSRESNTFTIAFVVSSLENPFFKAMHESVVYECQKNNILLFVYDSNNSTEIESQNIEAIQEKAVDLVLFNPVDVDESSQALMFLNMIEKPVIAIDRGFKKGQVVSEITSNNYKGGQMAGTYLQSVLQGPKTLLILEGIRGTTANTFRVNGIKDALEDSNIEIINQVSGNFERDKAYSIMQTYFKQNKLPDAIFASNDEMALGALDSMLENYLDIIIIGFDGTNEAIEAVMNGYMTATIKQDYDEMARVMIQTSMDYLRNITVEPLILIDTKLIAITQKKD